MNLTPNEWELFKNSEISVLCNTKEKAIDFLTKAENEGIDVSICNKEQTNWNDFGEYTYYWFSNWSKDIQNYDITTDEIDEKLIKWEIDNNDKESDFYLLKDLSSNAECCLHINKEQVKLLDWCSKNQINFKNCEITKLNFEEIG